MAEKGIGAQRSSLLPPTIFSVSLWLSSYGIGMTAERHELRRVITLPGAVGVGVGSIIGTGAFVTLGLGASIAGPWLLLAIAIAGGLAMCNGLSSAQLATVHPVSGGTYAYGTRFIHPWAGFTAGWVFLLAKSAS